MLLYWPHSSSTFFHSKNFLALWVSTLKFHFEPSSHSLSSCQKITNYFLLYHINSNFFSFLFYSSYNNKDLSNYRGAICTTFFVQYWFVDDDEHKACILCLENRAFVSSSLINNVFSNNCFYFGGEFIRSYCVKKIPISNLDI